MKIVLVPHGAKVTGNGAFPAEIASDPPMTMEGKLKMLELVPKLKRLAPYDGVYSSIMDRACGSMCTIAKALGVKRVICIDELGQHANLDKDGSIVRYPGHEAEDCPEAWQSQGLQALAIIFSDLTSAGLKETRHTRQLTVLAFTHRPILAGIVAKAERIANIQGILDDPKLVENGHIVIEYGLGDLHLARPIA
jgi:broad specificity phosphatase PhoE